MGLPTPGTNKLQVLRAVEDGWHAFCRAPWAFLLFQALVLVVMAPFAALLVAGAVRLNGPEPAVLHPVAASISLVVGLVGYVVVALWAVVGLSRGAWLSLEGTKISPAGMGPPVAACCFRPSCSPSWWASWPSSPG